MVGKLLPQVRTSAASGSSMNSSVAVQEATSQLRCQLAGSTPAVVSASRAAAPAVDTAAGPQLAVQAAAGGTARDK